MKREYRILEHNGFFYPQVREVSKFLFKIVLVTRWEKIGKHNVGYGLYGADDYNNGLYPIGYARTMIDEYEQWKCADDKIKIHPYAPNKK